MNLTKKIFLFSICWLALGSCQSSKQDTENQAETGLPDTITSFDQWLNDPIPIVSAHRGGPYPGFPENAIETFQHIADQISTVIECDVSMTKDSVLVLLHDRTLDRTTTGQGDIREMLFEEVINLSLVDNDSTETNFKIPTLDETLAWGKGKVLFTLDVKRGVPFDKVITTVEAHGAEGYAAIITYRIQDAKLVHSLNSELMISISAGSDQALEQIIQSGIPSENILGFVGTREPDLEHYEKVRELGIKTILGTLGNLDKSAQAKGDDSVYLRYIENGANIIATDRPLEVARVLGTK